MAELKLNLMATDNMLNNNLTNPSAKSDAKKLADQHLADPNHVITDEDLQKIRVGVTGEADAPTREAVSEAEDRVADEKADSEADETPGAQKMTPWDTINP